MNRTPDTREVEASPTIDRREVEDTKVVDLHEPIARELSEPKDGFEPPPMWLLFLGLALAGFCGWYLGTYSGGFRAEIYDEAQGSAGVASADIVHAPVDPMVLGKRVYNNCMACHQRDGAGVPGNYPPLDGSDWVTGSPAIMTALVLVGVEGEMEVGGVSYNQVMPQWGHLTDQQIAAVVTFVRGSWSNQASEVKSEFVAQVRDGIGNRSRPWRSDELAELELDVETGGNTATES
ncbi:MAG: cytochrome c [bacterium]|nr:cytochrome c [bacterium]